jgi:putative RNA 2'-phosphotransferase
VRLQGFEMGRHDLKKLGKIIEYILLHRPDEFGLFLDDDGALPIKELLWALHEETGWKHIRSGHLKELSYSDLHLAFTVEDKLIRPKSVPSQVTPVGVPPALLFFAAKRKAYPAILKHGLRPGARLYVPLGTTEEMALRIGKRRDPKPILLTVHASRAHNSGLEFFNCGQLLYLVKSLPPAFMSGPPLRETPQPRKVSRPAPPQEPQVPQMVGSFLLDPARDPDLMRRRRRKQKQDRKRQIDRERRSKKRQRS